MSWGVGLQFIFGLIVLRWETGRQIVECLGKKITIFLNYSDEGSGLVYGYLVTDKNNAGIALGTVFAFKVISIKNFAYAQIVINLSCFIRFFLSSSSSASASASCIITA